MRCRTTRVQTARSSAPSRRAAPHSRRRAPKRSRPTHSSSWGVRGARQRLGRDGGTAGPGPSAPVAALHRDVQRSARAREPWRRAPRAASLHRTHQGIHPNASVQLVACGTSCAAAATAAAAMCLLGGGARCAHETAAVGPRTAPRCRRAPPLRIRGWRACHAAPLGPPAAAAQASSSFELCTRPHGVPGSETIRSRRHEQSHDQTTTKHGGGPSAKGEAKTPPRPRMG